MASSSKILTHLGVSKNTTVIVASILAKIKQSETVVGIANGKEHNAEKAFIVMEEGASEFWTFDLYVSHQCIQLREAYSRVLQIGQQSLTNHSVLHVETDNSLPEMNVLHCMFHLLFC